LGRPTHDADLPLTLLSRFPLDTGACLSRCTLVRFGEPRRDRFHPAAVTRRSFSRSRAPSFRRGMRCSSASLSSGDCAPCTPWTRPARAPPRVPSRPFERPRPVGRGVAHPVHRESTFSSPTALSATRSFAAKSLVLKARAAWNSGLDLERFGTSVGQAPVHRVPRPSFERLRIGGRASLGQGRLSTSATETYSVRAHPRDRLRARLETSFLLRGVRSPCVCRHERLPEFPQACAPWAARHHCTTGAGLLWPPKPSYGRAARCRAVETFRRPRPRCSHGPTVLKRRARSLLGILRAPLLRSQSSIPLSPTCCHGHLECVRRAARGPSRQVSLAERGRGWPHMLA